ncbi:hypothetical protein FM107_09090 [Sphingobacterium sp. JB170]|nr:hypothetical protein FM107_09090 [Sphingobacterium sp. JB170]
MAVDSLQIMEEPGFKIFGGDKRMDSFDPATSCDKLFF